jgi:hypothetical protein
VQTLVDDAPIGPPADNYSPSVIPKPRTALGTVDLTAGKHRLTFRVVGKNPSSSGYLAGIDCLELLTAP